MRAPLPVLSDELAPLAAVNSQATGDPRYVLPYHHFSVVLNKERRLAFYTAVNIDGASGMRLRREADRWSFDPRIPQDEQTGEEVYKKNPLDRGHLVRRLDPVWGPSATAAKTANDDTFHFTNCTPQHHDFNAGQTLWAGLEDYILDHADNLRFRVCVFTGPVFAADDDQYRGLQLPRQFWKVAAMIKQTGVRTAPTRCRYGRSRTSLVFRSGRWPAPIRSASRRRRRRSGRFSAPATSWCDIGGDGRCRCPFQSRACEDPWGDR
jgi:endonuclease G, mitochondrial